MNVIEASSKSPSVSVIIPLYNHGKYIKETINSVLNQSFQDFELIIINDGSSDNSEEIVKSINDPRIIYKYQENQGAHAAINNGASLAQGKYISILNSDDLFKTDKLKESFEILENNNDIAAVFSDFEMINQQGEVIKIKGGAKDNWGHGFNENTSFKGTNNILLNLLGGNFLGTTSNIVCRKSTFNELEGFVNIRYTHDYYFLINLCFKYKTHFIEKSLFQYRYHDANTISEAPIIAEFEAVLTLTEFLFDNKLTSIYKDGSGEIDNDLMIKFFNSINLYHADRVMAFLLLFCMQSGNTDIITELRFNLEHPLRKEMLERIKWAPANQMREKQIASQMEKAGKNRLFSKIKNLLLSKRQF